MFNKLWESRGIMHNPEYFEDPMAFKPERYFKDGQLNPEVMDPEVAAFGFGRRCESATVMQCNL
jgi:cytochrome P450